jgi:hypothetical protein
MREQSAVGDSEPLRERVGAGNESVLLSSAKTSMSECTSLACRVRCFPLLSAVAMLLKAITRAPSSHPILSCTT